MLTETCPVAVKEYESVVGTSTSDAVCSRITVCNEDEYEILAFTPTTDRGCLPLTTCVFEVEYEAIAPTETSDHQVSLELS